MYASFTSTSTSSVDRSAMVTIAVRVRPPPAEEGATISPTSASFRSTVPENGARPGPPARKRGAPARFPEVRPREPRLGAGGVRLGHGHLELGLRVLEVGV